MNQEVKEAILVSVLNVSPLFADEGMLFATRAFLRQSALPKLKSKAIEVLPLLENRISRIRYARNSELMIASIPIVSSEMLLRPASSVEDSNPITLLQPTANPTSEAEPQSINTEFFDPNRYTLKSSLQEVEVWKRD